MNNNRSDIIIDLTSLLDVIFILILVIMCNQFTLKSDYENKISEAEETSASANIAQGLYEQHLETQDNINSFVYAVAIYSRYEPDTIANRTIHVLREGEDVYSIDLVGNATEDAFESLKQTLIEYAKEYPDNPVIFSLNENDEYILYRDEKRINEILMEISNMEECSNVYLRGYIGD